MMGEYYYLKKDEVIREGDECEMSNGWNADPMWVKTTCVGEQAPDPRYPAHRIYRRAVSRPDADIGGE